LNAVVIIMARGGSKRLPRKNVLPFCGRPLIHWSIMAAKESKLAREVFVTTDDDEIAEVSKDEGATIIRRDWVSPDDEPGTYPVVKALDWIEANREWKTDVLLTMLPTGPCRAREHVDAGIAEEWKSKWWYTLWGYAPQETWIQQELSIGGMATIFLDKEGRYVSWVGHDAVTFPENARAWNEKTLKTGDLRLNFDVCGHVPIKLWECHDADTEDQFEASEYWFKRKMIDVYGQRPYGEKDA
jgi:N-acylneuraminate cytidylyltransferase